MVSSVPATTDLCCKSGHPLVRSRCSLQLKCDQCGSTIPSGDYSWSCARCDFDLCSACASGKLHAVQGAPDMPSGEAAAETVRPGAMALARVSLFGVCTGERIWLACSA